MRVYEIFRAAQSRERDDELECRAWRQATDRTVDQWIGLVFLQCYPIFRLDTRDKSIRVE